MRELVFNNSFLGKPSDVICPCKQWFGDVVLVPYIKYKQENIHVAVHKASGRLIGYLTGFMGGQYFEKIWNYQVDEEFRGRGIGATLLQRFVNDAVNYDFQLIWAEVMAYPEKPREYFEDRGWSIYDSKPTMVFGNHVDFSVQILRINRALSSFDALLKLT